MKEYDYKAIPYKERLTTLCGIAIDETLYDYDNRFFEKLQVQSPCFV